MPQRAKTTTTDALFGALSNPTRRDILDLLLEGEHHVQDIAERFDMSRPSVSEHLKLLKDAGLVSEHQHGRHRYYRINPEPLHQVQTWLAPYERFWRQRLTELGQVLDNLPEPAGQQAARRAQEDSSRDR